MADLRIVDAPLLSTVKGTEKIPTGGEGNFSVSVNQVADFAKLKWVLATEDYVDNAVGNVQSNLNLHKNNVSNPHQVTKAQVGLGNVDNTADLDKPLSNATQSAIITANSGKADKSYVDSQDQLKADKVYVDSAVGAISTDASKQYATLALANADIANIALNKNIFVSEATNGGYWYKATAGATTLTKSPYDPLTQANTNTEQQMIRALFSRYGVAKNLLSVVSASSSNPSTEARVRWTGSAINLDGIFVALRLSVEGASYPTVATDRTAFSSDLRLQAFVGGTLSINQNLTRLGNTDIWYFRNPTLSTAGITEIKVILYPAAGVTVKFDNAVIQNDSSFGFPEIEARNSAISSSITADYEGALLSQYREGASRNLLGATTSGTSNSVLQLAATINQTLTNFSAACILECDGDYPTISNATSLALKADVFRGTNVLAGSAYMKRIGNSNVWYVSDIAAGVGPHTSVKISSAVPAGSTYVTVRQAVFVDGGYASPLFLLLDKLASDVTATATAAATASAITAANNAVSDALSGANLGWPTTAFDAIGRATARRVDIVGFGDSNQFMDNYGFDGAIRNALASRFGLYATPPSNGGVYGVSTGATLTQQAKSLAGVAYNYVADGSTVGGSGANALLVGNGTVASKYLINPSSKLRCHFAYSTFASGSGNFRVGARQEASPYTTYAQSASINTNTGAETYQLSSFDIEAGSRDGNTIGFRFAQVNQTLTGPFLSYFMRVEDVNKDSGVCFSTLYGAGGQSLWDMCSQAYTWSMQELTNYFSEIRRLQLSKNQKPIVVVYVNSGLNDRNETSVPSLGWRANTVGDSPTAYLDNFEALAKRISDVWQHNGWDERELFFWVNPSHPVSTPDDTKLTSYRKAAYSFAGSRERVSFLDLTNLTTANDLQASGMFKQDGSGNSHLTKAGYDYVASLMANQIH